MAMDVLIVINNSHMFTEQIKIIFFEDSEMCCEILSFAVSLLKVRA